MATERQRAANRMNADRSTGPRSAVGKARSAQNPRRHGLTTPPEAAAVTRWYRIILDDPIARPDPFEHDPRLRAARDLAEAEAHLARVKEAEGGALHDLLRNEEEAPGRAALYAAAKEFELDIVERSAVRILRWAMRHGLEAGRRQLRLYARYSREGEARRRKALHRWIEEIPKRSQFPP